MNLPKVLSFSGGRTSGYMLRREIDRIGIEEYKKQFITLFCNTGKEHDATLDFVHDVEIKWGVPVIWLEYCRIPALDIPLDAFQPESRKQKNLEKLQKMGQGGHWFRVVNWTTAARENQRGPFDDLLDWANVLPNVRTRMCSVQMKLRTMQRYLGSRQIWKYQSLIGIRADESHRKLEILVNVTSCEIPAFPLIDEGQSATDVHSFWKSHQFDLRLPVINGETIEGNCRRCFLKATWKLVTGIKDDPESATWWHDKEAEFLAKGKTTGAVFKQGRPFSKLIRYAEQLKGCKITPPKQRSQTAEELPALDFGEEDVACSCSIGGYRANNNDIDEP
jgi:3'-phosphoadenosine 5'-phosphosulfate sulfotransferase (PAPS reductase)/FAD synthetase